jgi:hypothetical protein
MSSFGWMLIVAALMVILVQSIYFHRQRKMTEKYPFYSLRDEVIWLLVSGNGDTKTLMPIYDRINAAVNELRRFNFRFYAGAMAAFVHHVVEEGYKYGFDPTKDWNKGWAEKREPLHPLIKQFAGLIIQTARRNSFLIQLSMTRFGRRILLTATLPIALNRFVQNHPEFMKKLRASRDYAAAEKILSAC